MKARKITAPGGRHQGRRLMATAAGLLFLTGGAAGALAEHRQLHQHPPIVATVGASRIDQDSFFGRMQRASGPETLRTLVNEQLLLQFAAKRKELPSDAAVDALLAEKRRQSGFQQAAQRSGITRQDQKTQLRLQLIQADVLGQGKQVTDADLRKVYEENIDPANTSALYYRPETTTVAVIVTPSEVDAQRAAKALQTGAEFGVVAQQYSKDASALRGGIVGPIPKSRFQASRVPGLQDAIFGLRVGQQTGPEQIGGAWWIIRCLERSPAVVTPFQSVREDCRRIATARKGLAQYNHVAEEYQKFRAGSNIQVFWPQYQQAVAQ